MISLNQFIHHFRPNGPYRLHHSLFDQQHLRLCKHASRCCFCHYCHVGHSQTVYKITWMADDLRSGMHIIAATFLLPVGVTVYTFVGGIKATFLTDYFHTAIILIVACFFTAKAFSDDQVGSVGNLYELLKAAAERHPVSGNQGGSYLTMTSKSVRASCPIFLRDAVY